MGLPLNLEELRRAAAKGIRYKYVFFWGHRQGRAGAIDKACFSQWYPAKIEVDGHRYGSAEHFMMAEKARLFDDGETLDKILKSPNPGAAKQLGRQVKGFVEDTWQSACFDIVVRGNLAKFSQNGDMGSFLKSTKKRVLAEASPVDRMWGIGLAHDNEHVENPLKWRGRNLLGFALMVVRSKLG